MNRFFEILPGLAAWATLVALFVFSAQAPAVVVIFIVLYDLYWLLKVLYLFFHLQVSFSELKRNMRIDWLSKLEREESGKWEKIRHLVIFPMYRESYGVVSESLRSLVRTNYPKDRFLIVLATEERGGDNDRAVAERITSEFGKEFGSFIVTRHPEYIPGEIPGKGSNETWAAREAKRNLIDPLAIPYEDILVSVFDIDTRTGPEYFGVLTHHFLKAPSPQRSSYQPTPLFINNIYSASLFSRLIGFSATFWQLMQQGRPEQLVTFSSHSMPFKALVEIGFWHTDIVSEDSRVFFQCLIHFEGDWRTVPMVYPIYMDAVVGGTFWDGLKNLYRQQRRWAWGVENFVYVADAFRKTSRVGRSLKWFWLLRIFDGFYAWSTSSFIIFIFGWLPNILGNDVFRTTVLSYNLPRVTGVLINLSSVGIITSAVLSLALLPKREGGGKQWLSYAAFLLQWVLMPFTFIFFGSVPALEAQTRMMLGGRFRLGFWKTPKVTRIAGHETG